MKLIRIIILLIFSICLIGGCQGSNEDIVKVDKVLVGESEHWKASYKAKGFLEFYEQDESLQTKYDGSDELTIEYKGTLEELNSMKKLKVESPSGSTSTFEYGLDEAPYSVIFEYKGDLNPRIIQKISQGKKIEFVIMWDGTNGSTEIIQVK
ncbi:MAG: hypothetical protein CVU84_02165 [Firmicutes bacterium HGW-Firmicutes-1]|jgi:hypothetical protein|nr:MAG: hypothetical protein CVU84_02165 [Firmicutes bacterium HGW-Firmicutes-1]